MQEVTIGQPVGDQLGQLANQVVLCDDRGRALGLFSPLPGHPRVEDLQLEPPMSIAETEKLRATRSGKPLNEILARLGIQ